MAIFHPGLTRLHDSFASWSESFDRDPGPTHTSAPDQQRSRQHSQFNLPIPAAPTPIQQPNRHASVDATTLAEPMEAKAHGHGHGQLSNRIVVDPPNLQEWRERLFNVDEMIILTDDQFETYFPHVDNVYSHRSTQRYKRKPFVSHYWDCRMKGRPSGTPKSDDPNKKKRKRQARERDLCDVKIKITEYFAGAAGQLDGDPTFAEALQQSVYSPGHQDIGVPAAAPSMAHPGTTGQRFWTIQRVNGNGCNGKGDGVAGPHKHTLAKSDEIKKNSVQRYLAEQDKESKKSRKQAQRRPSGSAFATAKKRAKESDIKLYSACFCPFSQRVWIALEAKGLSYQYCEIDPLQKPTQLLEANPRGLVPAIRQGDWACAESAVILEYLEDAYTSVPLYPTDPRLRANCRLWIDYINSKIVPSFYNLLRATESSGQNEHIDQLQSNIRSLVLAADEQGPFFLGSSLCLVDIHFAPFAIRLSRVLQPSCGWTGPVPGTRWQRWLDAMEQNVHIRGTTSLRELYMDTMELLAQTSPVTR